MIKIRVMRAKIRFVQKKITLDANIKNLIYGMIYKFDIKCYRRKHIRKRIKYLEIVFYS